MSGNLLSSPGVDYKRPYDDGGSLLVGWLRVVMLLGVNANIPKNIILNCLLCQSASYFEPEKDANCDKVFHIILMPATHLQF